jgi:hypothetical protein
MNEIATMKALFLGHHDSTAAALVELEAVAEIMDPLHKFKRRLTAMKGTTMPKNKNLTQSGNFFICSYSCLKMKIFMNNKM